MNRVDYNVCSAVPARWKALPGELLEAVNARRHPAESKVWVAAGKPGQLRTDRWRPFEEIGLDDGSTAVFFTNGMLLGVATTFNPEIIGNLAVEEVGQLAGEPLGVEKVLEGMVKVYLRHAPAVYVVCSRRDATLDAPSRWSFALHGEMPEFPQLHLEVEREQLMSEAVAGMKIQSVLASSADQLSTGEIKTLSASVSAAYQRLEAHASHNGYSLQPVLARCRVEDQTGRTLSVGAPVLMASSQVMQCGEGATFVYDADNGSLRPSALQAKGFNIRVKGFRQIAEPWRRLAHRVVVETTAPLSTFGADGMNVRPQVRNDGREITVRIALPGYEGSEVAQLAAVRKLVAQALADDCWIEQAAVLNPFTGDVAELSVPIGSGEAVKGSVSQPRPSSESYRWVGRTSAGRWLAADPLRAPFDGFTPLEFLVAREPGEGWWWRAVATVTLRQPDGSERIAVSGASAEGEHPLGFSPILVYPDANAVSIRLAVQTERGITEATYPLRCMPGGKAAYYISPDLKPLMPSGPATVLESPASTVRRHVEQGVLVFAPEGALAEPRWRWRIDAGSVYGAAEWPAAAGSWDFSRTKLAVASSRGIFQACFNSADELHAVRRVCSTGVSGAFVECADDGGRFLLAPSPGVALIIVRGSRGVRLPGAFGNADEAAFCTTSGEYWCIDRSGELVRRWVCAGGVETAAVEFDEMGEAEGFISWHGRLLVATSAGLFDADAEQGAEGAVFRLSLRHDLGNLASAGWQMVRLNVFGERLAGCVDVGGEHGTRVAGRLMRHELEGDLNEPIVAVVASGGRRYLHTEVNLRRASASVEVRPTELSAGAATCGRTLVEPGSKRK